MAICEICGSRYNKQKVKDEILEVCRIWSDSDFSGMCFCCVLQKFIDDTGYDPTLDMEEDENDTDDACIACSNPAYPECQTGCPLFDD